MSKLVYLNGEFVAEEEAKVSVWDHGYLYGDGVFEGIRAYNGRIFKLKEHVKRLFESAKSIMLEINMTEEEMCKAIAQTVKKNELKDAYIRVVVSRGVGDLGLDPNNCTKSQVVIIASKITLFSDDLYENGLEVVTVATRRNAHEALNPKIKSLNYLNNILVKIEANLAGVKEALMINNEGYVAEGSGDNVFIIKDGVIYTPPPYAGILNGITRQTVMELAEEKGYPVKEELFTRHDVYVSDECFLTGTAAEIIPVIKVDGRSIGNGNPGTITKDLMELFREHTLNNGVSIYDDKDLAV
ncbi:branched-chain-amino-acid transaminase [Natranaerofaba carboxydovora]|uniref:branched-chain-amino-acid transaminase n=1 Tax=Natranaerofaba carboxydovora TaxID=2742683 RepID=UPI001F13C17D|nr:branched-chain-amino-acid transaminase [Natranaerofaba carboxydovora]UMZ75204.1 Branched-chain-amino-acid aminotransferase [Natranaerofaba carboxydovora]